MKMITGVVVVAAATMMLGGCGGDTAEVGSGQEVADMIGCTGYTGDSEEMFVTEGGGCDLDGERVTAYYFGNDETQTNFVGVTGFGGLYLVGDGWAVEGPRAVLEDLQTKHGGDIEAG